MKNLNEICEKMTPKAAAQIVAQCYEGFIHGNCSFLDELTDDIIWIDHGCPGAYCSVKCKGKNAILVFLENLNETVEFEQYKQEAIILEGNKALTLGRLKGRAKDTGKCFEHINVLIWTFRDGKISRYKAYNVPIMEQ